jgi:excisionase family DNA binding protein
VDESNECRLLSVEEVGERLSVCRASVYKLMEAGELPYCMIGKRRRVKVADLERFVEGAKVHGGAG